MEEWSVESGERGVGVGSGVAGSKGTCGKVSWGGKMGSGKRNPGARLKMGGDSVDYRDLRISGFRDFRISGSQVQKKKMPSLVRMVAASRAEGMVPAKPVP